MGVPCPCVGAVATLHRDGGKWALGRAVGWAARYRVCATARSEGRTPEREGLK